MHIGLISAAFPPDLDGIGDYTWWMAKTLAEGGHRVTVYTRCGTITEAAGVVVEGFYDPDNPGSFAALVATMEAGDAPDWVVLQYNPFSWGPRGFCPTVGRTLETMRRGPERPGIAVMFHETMVPQWPWKFAVMRVWQERFFGQVCRAADRIFVSTERWLPQVRASRARAEASVLAVGSNIPVSPLTAEEARAKLGVAKGTMVVGIFGGAHGSRRLDWIAAAMKRYMATANFGTLLVVHVGPDSASIARTLDGIPLLSLGVLPASDVADALRAMDCVMSPFVDGMSTRRTSAVAPLANGVPVATTARKWTDAVFRKADPRAVLLSPATDGERFADDAVPWMLRLTPEAGEGAREFAGQVFAWSAIRQRLMDELAAVNCWQTKSQIAQKSAVR